MGDDERGMIGRVMRILASFDEDHPQLKAAEIAERTGIALSSAHRLLATLVSEGVLLKLGHEYAIGTRLWEIGELSPIALRLRERALPHMLRLYEATGENVHLGALHDPSPAEAEVLFAGRVTGRGSVPTLGRGGGRHPLHTTGIGKAILATRDEAWLAEYLTTPLLPETQHSLTDPDALLADLEGVRARGYARTSGEMTLGNISIAAAVPLVIGLPQIAIGIVARAEDARDEERIARLVTAAARDLGRDLRDDGR